MENKEATVYLDWTPSEHSIKFESFNFVCDPLKENTISFDKDSGARPMPIKISFDLPYSSDIIGNLKFSYEDLTSKVKGEGSVKVSIK